MGTSHKERADQPLDPADARALRAVVKEMGEPSACRALGVNRHTLARCLSGLPVRAGTRALVAAALASVERQGAA